MVNRSGPTRIGDLLLRKELITAEQLAIAIAEQQHRRDSGLYSKPAEGLDKTALGEVLIDLSMVSRKEINKCLGWQARLRRATYALALATPLITVASPATAAPKKFTDPSYTNTETTKGSGKGWGRGSKDTSAMDTSAGDTTSSDTVIVDASEPIVEDVVADSTHDTLDTPVEEPVVEDTTAADPIVEEPVVVEPVPEEPATSDTVADNTAPSDTTSEPIVEEMPADEPVVVTDPLVTDPMVEEIADVSTEDPTVEVIEPVPTEPDAPIVFEVQLSWAAPDARENGENLVLSDIGGYEILYRKNGDTEYRSVLIYDGQSTDYVIGDLVNGEYEFQIAAFDNDGIYSDFSAPITRSF